MKVLESSGTNQQEARHLSSACTTDTPLMPASLPARQGSPTGAMTGQVSFGPPSSKSMSAHVGVPYNSCKIGYWKKFNLLFLRYKFSKERTLLRSIQRELHERSRKLWILRSWWAFGPNARRRDVSAHRHAAAGVRLAPGPSVGEVPVAFRLQGRAVRDGTGVVRLAGFRARTILIPSGWNAAGRKRFMSLGWILLGLVGWAFGLVVVLALFRM